MSQSKFVAFGLLLCATSFLTTARSEPIVVEPHFSNEADRKENQRLKAILDKGPYLIKATAALPVASDLPDYEMKIADSKTVKKFHATRRADKAFLKVGVIATPNAEARDLICQTSIAGDVMGRLPKGSPSGKPLGEQSWQSWGSEPKSTMKAPDYFLLVQDGPSVIRIELTAYIGQDKKGRAEWTPITQADRLDMERIARLMLRNLAALKLTKATYRG